MSVIFKQKHFIFFFYLFGEKCGRSAQSRRRRPLRLCNYSFQDNCNVFFFQRPYTIDPPAPCAASSLVMYFSSSLRLMDGVCAVSTGQGHHSRTCLHSSPPSRLVRYPAATFTHALHSPPSPVHPSGGIVKNQIGCVLSAVSVSIARQKENPNISSFPSRNELKAKRLQKLREKQHSCNPHFLNY